MARVFCWTFAALLLFACGGSDGNGSAEQLARDHMSIARALESESRWNDAALEYAIVGDLYASTSYYETAVRKAASLFSHPENHEASDSTMFRWLQEYSTLSLGEGERTLIESHVHLLKELRRTENKLRLERSVNDSLVALMSSQRDTIAAGEAKIRKLEKDLERKLAQTKEELEKLREIDIKVGREKGKE